MKIYALVGPSGTGKSTIALSFAHSMNIPAIIDDGLLIFKGSKVAGTSSKYEKNTITSIKRAIFFFEDHLKEVQNTIRLLAIDSILIIGTSRKMVNEIARRLQLGEITKYFHIEEIRSSKEIKMALFIRKTEGKHIIPIPITQTEQNIIKRIIMRGKRIFSPQKELIGETTIIQPNFLEGTIHISKKVFKQIVSHGVASIKGVKECKNVELDLNNLPNINVSIIIYYPFHKKIIEIVEEVQKKIADDFITYLDIELSSINVSVINVAIMKGTVKNFM
jgi:uncharacterized alkaline shock family protein YloU